ncbi:hypothetical protein [uncultured Aquimarina sp.]|uniref:hypothetical protein n=1 Tax=uncultured Aquimarina sp. TaxID=575652 RepID=UPI00262A53FF|nr:hypothetical protein [uncultured Aquimarina sp.]
MEINFDLIGEKSTPNIDLIKNMISFSIPKSYLEFIENHGFGVVSENVEYLNIIAPDKNFFENNFKEDIDLWEWKDNSQKDKIHNSLLIAHTFDGQHVYCTESSFLILPRFETPIEFYTFNEVIEYYTKIYNMVNTIKYRSHKGY